MKRVIAIVISVLLVCIIGGAILAIVRYIHVEPNEARIVPVLHSGAISNERYGELKDEYIDLLRESDPHSAIEKLQMDAEESVLVAAVCHDLLHNLGREAFHIYGSFDAALGYTTDFCNSGFLHGLFESYFAQTPDPLNDLDSLCTQDEFLRRIFDMWQCHHGLGHGLMYFTGGMLEESLVLCERLPQGAKDSCQNGVYMESFNGEILPGEHEVITRDPLTVCADAVTAKGDCYTYVATHWSQVQQRTFDEMFALCEGAEYGYKSTCIAGVGSEAMKRNMLAPENVFALCQTAPSRAFKDVCVQGMVSMYMNQHGTYESGVELCSKASSDLVDACKQRVAVKEALFSPIDL